MINCYSFGDCASFMTPYEPIPVQTRGELHKLKGQVDLKESGTAFIPSLKSEQFGKNGVMKIYAPSFVRVKEQDKHFDVLDDLIKDEIELEVVDANQMKRNDTITALITIRYIDSLGKLVLFVLEKIINLSVKMTDDAMRAFKYEIGTKMRESIVEKKNYDIGLAFINEYKRMDIKQLSNQNKGIFETITDYFIEVLIKLKEKKYDGKEEDMKNFIDDLLSKDTNSNILREGY